MQIFKVATTVALSTGLLFGCNSDGLPTPTDLDSDALTSALTDGYWELSETAALSNSFSSMSDSGLPNVYRFSINGSTLYFYTDESNSAELNTRYERFETTYTETIKDETSGDVSFTLFNADGSVSTVVVDGNYSVSDSSLVITDTNIPLTGLDHSDDPDVTGPADSADQESGVNNAAQIIDTLTTDTGELRLKIIDSSSTVGKTISSGKLTADLTYQLNPDSKQSDVGQNNAYISLYSTNSENNKVSNSYHHGDIAIGDGTIQYRDPDGSLTATNGTYDTNEPFSTEVEVTWTPNSHVFTINGESYVGAISSNSSGEVQVIAFRLSTNSGMTPYELIVDNLAVYSLDETTGEYVKEFEDDFNEYAVGSDLNNTPYNSNTSETSVINLSGEQPVVEAKPTDNQVAAITDTDASDTGELRYKFDSGMTTGTHKVSMYYDAAETESAYVALFDSANSTSSLIGELKIDEGTITLRGESVQVTTFTPNSWIDLEMSWDTSSTSEIGSYTVKVNGTEYGPYQSQNTTFGVPVTATAIKFSSNSGTAATTLYIDDYEIYSDTAGSVEVFSDDYQSYVIGNGLGSPYNSSTFSAVATEDPVNAE